MPTYSYACRDCGHAFDVQQAFTDGSLTECPECHGTLRKIFSAVGVVFKGSGFYRNDSRSTERGSSGSAGKGSTGGSSEGSSSGSGDAAPEKTSSSTSGKDTKKASSPSSTSSTSSSTSSTTSG